MNKILNFILNSVANPVIAFICAILPASPFQSFIRSNIYNNKYLQMINYFVPVGVFISIGEAWLTCIALYYLYQFVFKLYTSLSGSAITNVPKI